MVGEVAPAHVAFERISSEVGYGSLDTFVPPGMFSNSWRDTGGLTVVLSGYTSAVLSDGCRTILLVCRNFGGSPIRFHSKASRSFLTKCFGACQELPIRVVVFTESQRNSEPSLEYESPKEALRKLEEIIEVFSDS